MAESATELGEPQWNSNRAPNHENLTPEELVAKAIAPIKKQFLGPPPAIQQNHDVSQNNDNRSQSSSLVTVKKSKRQIKRLRREDQKSASNLCPVIAKTGDVNSCQYKDNCRFSHDVEAFKAQKPADLEGECPFLSVEGPCPYGLSCRYLGTHKDGVTGGTSNVQRKNSEVNGLKKEVQRLLWKNKMKFPKADARLKSLGLMNVAKSKMIITEDEEEEDGINSNNSHATDGNGCTKGAGDSVDESECPPSVLEDNVDKTCAAAELRPLKKAKSETIVNGCSGDVNNGVSVLEGDSGKTCGQTESVKEVQSETIKNGSSNDVNNGVSILEGDSGKSCGRSEPLKKLPSETIENGCSGVGLLEGVSGKSCGHTEPVAKTDIFTETDRSLKVHPREMKLIDFTDKLYLAPLTTVGNLPYRRLCKGLGADVTCGEMAMCTNLLQGQASEWALLRRDSSEDLFGVQICGAHPDTVARVVELIDQECTVDFIDINMGCPIDLVCSKGAGSSLLNKPMRMKNIIESASGTVETPITVKVRTSYYEGKNRIDSIIAAIFNWGASAVTIHGRSRQQRYSKLADWDYVYQCARKAPTDLQVLGNGDISSFVDWNKRKSECPELTSCMIARGALVKPWIFTEIKEQRHWDISSGERLNILKDYVRFGLQHWGSDTKGVETTRHFLLEWLSYTHRYIPVGILDVIPQKLNWRPPSYFCRDDLETLMASEFAADWIRISEMLLGKVPEGFTFAPKHKSNSHDRAENG